MEHLLAKLRTIAGHHAATPDRDFDALLGDLKTALADYTPGYAYRARMSWDTCQGDHGWFLVETDANASLLASKGHQVEARLAGDWAAYGTEAGHASN